MLKIISLNIEGDRHLQRVIPFIQQQQPDVACLQEVCQKNLSELTAKTQLQALFSPLVKIPKQGVRGNAILTTKQPLTVKHHYYFGDSIVLTDQEQLPTQLNHPNQSYRCLTWIRLKHQDQTYTIANTHFTWSDNGQPNQQQYQDMQALINQLKKLPDCILCGDFNAPREGPVFQLLAQVLKPNLPSKVKATLDASLHRAGQDFGLVVDNIFTTPEYQVSEIKVAAGLSDHKAIVAKINKLN
ncbi:MAG: hypothetical protein GF390_02450 [Candidatus Pacebacteria bacterium]|nr:hypothetical protein [Candidatus Paceibacterota bacterium]